MRGELARRAVQRSIRGTVILYVRRKGPLFAQGIAYSLLIGSMPLLLLAASAAGVLYRYIPEIQQGVHWRLRDFLPDEVAAPIVNHLDSITANWAEIGAVGFVIMLFVAKGIFDSVGAGLSGVMGGKQRRVLWLNHLYSIFLTGLTITFFIAVSLDEAIIRLLMRTTNLTQWASLSPLLIDSFSVLLLATALAVTYSIFLPAPISSLRLALAPFGVAILWFILGETGQYLVAWFARFRFVYGVMSGAALFLVWLQIFSHLVLLGGMFICEPESRR